jgi:predicted phage tail protein
LEETIKAFIQTSNQNIQELQKVTMNNSQNLQELKNATMSNSQNLQEFKQFTHQAIAKMEGQIGQLANQVGERERGKFLSQPGAQPKRAICYWEYIRPFSWAGACASHHNFEVWNASG